jgi:hypothetical protein
MKKLRVTLTNRGLILLCCRTLPPIDRLAPPTVRMAGMVAGGGR